MQQYEHPSPTQLKDQKQKQDIRSTDAFCRERHGSQLEERQSQGLHISQTNMKLGDILDLPKPDYSKVKISNQSSQKMTLRKKSASKNLFLVPQMGKKRFNENNNDKFRTTKYLAHRKKLDKKAKKLSLNVTGM